MEKQQWGPCHGGGVGGSMRRDSKTAHATVAVMASGVEEQGEQCSCDNNQKEGDIWTENQSGYIGLPGHIRADGLPGAEEGGGRGKLSQVLIVKTLMGREHTGMHLGAGISTSLLTFLFYLKASMVL